MRVAVVGAGVGGLTAAVALHRSGVEVSVYERTADGASPGNGFGLAPNGRRVLAQFDVDPGSKGHGAALASMRLRRTDGDDLAHYDLGGGLLGVRRADLAAVLTDALPPGAVHFGQECVDVRLLDGGAHVEFVDGSGVDADVVIGADGLRSTVATGLVPRPPLEDSGQVCLRGFVATEGLPPEVTRGQIAWLGADRHFLSYPVDTAGTSVVAGFVPRDVADPADGRASLHDVLVAAFDGWHEDVVALSERAGVVTGHDVVDRAPFTPWSRGRVALLGDAAHPMLPHAGQGANQAIEDAAVLALLLGDRASRPGADPEHALLHYERIRRPRTERVQAQARRNGKLFSGGAARSVKRSNEHADLSWIYDYDPLSETRRATHR